MSNEALVILDNVTKVFAGFGKERLRAVDRVSFTINAGEVYGFIGPNGAGKTTTLRMISTLLFPDEGEITIGGFNSIDQPAEVRSLIGYMPDKVGLYEGVRVWEYLEFFAAAYRLHGAAKTRVVAEVMELTDLGEVRDKIVTTLSKGMTQRLLLAKTLIHDPKLLVLDEPAAGLDPRARIELRVLIKQLKKMGKTVIISSHILTEMADMVDSVGIIEQGRMIASGTIDQILGGLGGQGLRLRIRVLDNPARAANTLRLMPGISEVNQDGMQLTFTTLSGEAELPGLLAALLESGVPLVEVSHESRNLEDLFLAVTRGAVA